MGIVQGLSEFLPVSSSGHIVLASAAYKVFTGAELNLHSSQEVFFDIMLHLGTLVAVLIFFKKEICDILKALWIAAKTRDFSSAEAKLGLFIILGTFFTCLVAYPIKDVAEKLVSTPQAVGWFLIGTGIILFFGERIAKKLVNKKPLGISQAILMGIAQGIAAFPGLSRSGLTIATGLLCGLDRLSAARFSFLLSIPIILGTSMLYPVLEINPQELAGFNWGAIAVGTLVSAFVGYFCIKYFLKFVAKFSLDVFAYYCFALGVSAVISFNFV